MYRPQGGPFKQREAAKRYYASRGRASAAALAAPGTVNLVSRDNGVGLSTDMLLLERILTPAGYDVQRADWTGRQMRPCQVAIFLELWNPILANFAKHTVGVFNLEWMRADWHNELPKLTQLWAKSAEAHQAFLGRGLSSVFTGFAALDLYDASVPRTMRVLHHRGRSTLKGTDAVLQAWRDNPGLPPLTVVSHSRLNAPPGVSVLPRIPQQQLIQEMNGAWIHVCPSESEGWGHYIAEGVSAGAIVITTDGSPMNEHVRPEWGYLIPPVHVGRRALAGDYRVTAAQVADTVRAAAALPEAQRAAMSERARAHAAARNASFRETALTQLARMC